MIPPASAQQPSASETGEPGQSAQTLSDSDLQDAIARDVLEPLQSGIQTQNLKQVVGVFDADSIPLIRDQFRAFFDSYRVLRFRYKLTQVSSENGAVTAVCEADLETAPVDANSGPLRHSSLLRLRLKQTPRGWRILALSPSNFFAQ